MKKLLVLVLALAMLCGCGAQTAADASAFAPAETDRLTVFTSLDAEVYASLVKEFEERTGIWVTVEAGGAPELMERIAAGEECDLLLGCGADLVEANAELFRSFRAEAEYSVWCPGGSCWTPVSLYPLVIVYNTRLVRQNLPTDWSCLLSDAWRGEIAFADPAVSDVSRTVLYALVRQFPREEPKKLLAEYAANLEQLLDSSQDVVSRVADGSYCLAVVPEDAALRRIDAGAELAVVYPEKGTWLVTDCAAIPVACAHPENAEAFVEFILGEDAQRHAWTTWSRGSVLAELACLPESLRFYDASGAGLAQPELLELWEAAWEVTP